MSQWKRCKKISYEGSKKVNFFLNKKENLKNFFNGKLEKIIK